MKEFCICKYLNDNFVVFCNVCFSQTDVDVFIGMTESFLEEYIIFY